MKRKLIAVASAFIAAGAMMASAQAGSYNITTGDVLSVYVYRQADMSVKVRVDADGYVRFPVAGRVKVANKNPDDIEKTLARALSRQGFANPEVVVTVESFVPRKIFVLGEVVGSENATEIPEGGEVTALQAISMNGGLTEKADIANIVVRRSLPDGKTAILPVPAQDILAGKQVADIQLKPYDTVVVPKQQAISVLGTVKKAGEFYTTPNNPLTVSRAVALAGGVERPKSLAIIRVMRGDKSYQVDIQSLLEDGKDTGDADMTLMPGDIVYVPETRW
ncbi:polysaccharide export protein [gut metagenome]|uniref:Polysaccharide export protein n=1 Tax=gut metagenome TaxID=749906 RepID=J9GQS3_9ZZZZ